MTATRRCRSRSRYGDCRRPAKHAGPHAVPIGDGVWFGYLRGGTALGYGRLHGDSFTSLAAERIRAVAGATPTQPSN